MKHLALVILIIASGSAASGCSDDSSSGNGGNDTDADSDSDTDVDTDSDTDADTDTDTDTNPEIERTVVVWRDDSNGINDIYVKELVDEAWVEVGAASAEGTGISGGLNDSQWPAVALDAAGNPVVAWAERDADGYDQIYGARFDGDDWVAMGSSNSGGGISDTTGTSDYPAIVMDAADNPIVAWSDATAGYSQIYVRRWDGDAWVEMGSGSATDGGVSNAAANCYTPALELDDAGDPFLVWGGPDIYALRFDGGAWVEVGTGSGSGGGISNSSGNATSPELAFDAAGFPIVAWENDTGGNLYNVYIKRFDGAAWVEVGAGSASGLGISGSSAGAYNPQVLVSSADVITVIYDFGSGYYNVGALQYGDDDWGSLGVLSQTPGWALYPTAVLDDQDQPIVAYEDEEDGGPDEIHVKLWNSSEWVEIGSSSASNGGISNNSGYSSRPDMARR